VVWTPWAGAQTLDTPSPKSGRNAPIVVVGETAWVAVHEGPNRAEDNFISLHAVDADGASLRRELAPAPAGASDSLLAFVGATPGELALIYEREFEDESPTEVHLRRIAVDGITPTVGEPTLLPGIDRAVLGRMSATHVGGGVLMLLWSESRDAPSGFYGSALLLRFVEV